MKQTNVVLRLDKSGHDVPLKNITPIEAILLVAEHHRLAGGNPLTFERKQEIQGGKEVSIIICTDVEPKRSLDDEATRLKMKYGESKVDTVLSKIRELPTEDFEKAVQLGVNLKLPTSGGVVSSTSLR